MKFTKPFQKAWPFFNKLRISLYWKFFNLDWWMYRRKNEKFNKRFQATKNGKRTLIWSNPPIRE